MMTDKQIKVANFLQDFGCAKLKHLQTIFEDEKNNFKSLLSTNMISKKGDVFVHNTQKIDEKKLVALDIFCMFKYKLKHFYIGLEPIQLTFLTKDNLIYHIIVADEEHKKGITKLVNAYPFSLPKADKLILAYPDREELDKIECQIPFIYTIYPNLEIINN